MTPFTMSSVSGSFGDLLSLSQKVVRNVSRLRAYRDDEATGMRPGQLLKPRMVTPFGVVWLWPGTVAAQLPPASAARSTMMLPALHAVDHRLGDDDWRFAAHHQGGAMTMSFLATVVAMSSACFWRNASLISRA